MNKSNILFIGFMGVGKGTISRAFVKFQNTKKCRKLCFSVDTDNLIENMENKTIKNIFQYHGEKYFRDLERKCALWCEYNLRNTVIATGGGFHKQPNIKRIGTIIYLESSFEKIIGRLKNSRNSKAKFKKRPLLQDLDEAKKLYIERIEEYKAISDFTINIEGNNVDSIVQKINKVINK